MAHSDIPEPAARMTRPTAALVASHLRALT